MSNRMKQKGASALEWVVSVLIGVLIAVYVWQAWGELASRTLQNVYDNISREVPDLPDGAEPPQQDTPTDSDGDGIPDETDTDDNNDGTPDVNDPNHPDYNDQHDDSDRDGDGIDNSEDTAPDEDGCGRGNVQVGDGCNPDLDNDGTEDSEDDDIDGDGVDNQHDEDDRDDSIGCPGDQTPDGSGRCETPEEPECEIDQAVDESGECQPCPGQHITNRHGFCYYPGPNEECDRSSLENWIGGECRPDDDGDGISDNCGVGENDAGRGDICIGCPEGKGLDHSKENGCCETMLGGNSCDGGFIDRDGVCIRENEWCLDQ